MITFDHVTKRYGERLALSSLSWHMEEGECVIFLGASGAGKTTLLRLITHETQPTSGRIVVGTFQGSRLGRHQRALLRRTLGIIYEDFRLLDDRTVFANVALAVHITGRFRDEDVVPQVLHALDEVGLRDKSDSFPRELSAGEKQRAAIARAIVNRPAVILADEPTGALEDASAREILERLRAIHAEGAALILVTTRREVAEAIPGRILELEDGVLAAGQAFPTERHEPEPVARLAVGGAAEPQNGPPEAGSVTTEVDEPQAEIDEPQAEFDEPRADAYEPQAEGYEPPVETHEPEAEVYEPPVETHEPEAEVYEPQAEAPADDDEDAARGGTPPTASSEG
jgi:cell division transport system ATP-binding protein